MLSHQFRGLNERGTYRLPLPNVPLGVVGESVHDGEGEGLHTLPGGKKGRTCQR